MEASTSNGSDDVKTFRGRSLEEVLPQIREELGPDAIVLRRREGLGGGVGGFFQRPYVEVDARPAQAHERPLEMRSDRATVEGLSSPAVQALFEQATPFADALAAAARQAAEAEPREDDFFTPSDAFAASLAELRPPEPQAPASGPGLYGPQPNADAIAAASPQPEAPGATPGTPWQGDDAPGATPTAETPFVESPPAPEPAPPAPAADEPPAETTQPAADEPPAEWPAPEPEADEPEEPAAEPEFVTPGPEIRASERPASADAAERRLIAAGLTPALAADVVGEAVAHALPFSAPRNLKRLVRTALARRIPVLHSLGPGPRTLAFVGGGGAGKSSAIVHLALAYADAGADVAVIALRGDGALAARLEPRGVAVIQADDAASARKRLGLRTPLVTLIDTPAAGPSSPATQIRALAADLRALGADEVHMALPATLSAPAAGELTAALAPLGPTHVALTHTDETARPGAPVELALAAGRPLSYVCAREGAEPADPASLAQQLLP
jgi:flagellar biosynthesis GTPase FlhF